jgi:hypothetical protein
MAKQALLTLMKVNLGADFFSLFIASGATRSRAV